MRESHCELEARIGLLTRELNEARERETATGELLRVIASSPTDIKPVLDAVAASAARLCDAYDVIIRLKKDDMLHLGAHSGPIAVDEAPWPLERDRVMARSVIDAGTVQVEDLSEAGAEFAAGREMAIQFGFRTILATPLVCDGRAIGAISLRRREVRPFSDRQIELLKTFADQAVIAISNVRLFEEVQARTAELSEALAQQTATADVLKVISRSAFDLQTVLDTLTVSAARLCDADMSGICRSEDNGFYFASSHGFPSDWVEYNRVNRLDIGRGSVVGRVLLDATYVHVADVLADPEYAFLENQRRAGFRTMMGVPMLRENTPIGVLLVARKSVAPFTDKQIELLQTFADQAVIAIENVRLFDEVQARTAELSEALRQQTATSEVLDVISRSIVELEPVFEVILENAARICDASFGNLALREGDGFRHVAAYGATEEWEEFKKGGSLMQPGPNTALGQALATRRYAHIDDVTNDPAFAEGDPLRTRVVELFKARTMLSVPLVKDDVVIGAITLHRQEVRPFTDKQIALVTSFASQAVIAIENARLFKQVQARTAELTEALEQQTATADVLKVISASTFDLKAVLQTLIESAVKLGGAELGGIYMLDGDVYHVSASHGHSPELRAHEEAHPNRVGRDSWVGRAALERAVVHVPDVTLDFEYGTPDVPKIGGFAAGLSVPLLREGIPIGVFSMARAKPGPFSERQIELVQTFADQAVIAIENVRLFEEVQQRTREATEALEYQTATSDVLGVISRSPTDVQPVFNMIAQSAARLCEAQFCFVYRYDGQLLHFVAHHGITEESVEIVRNTFPVAPTRGSAAERAILYLEVAQIPDLTLDSEFTHRAAAAFSGLRSAVAVPMLRDGLPIGCIAVGRAETGLLAAKQVELLKTFADQAVIAIENVRLFDEVQARTAELSESLQQQTATADVLKVISRSAFNLENVLDTLAESAAHLCEADIADFYRLVDDGFQWTTTFSRDPEAAPAYTKIMRQPGRGSVSGRVLLEQKTVHVPDFEADPEFTFTEVARQRGVRCILGVPLLRGTELMGLLLVMRKAPGPFSPKQIELVETFADQAVIAIENVRLFDEVQARTEELSRSLDDLRKAQDRLVQTEKLASLGQLTAGIAHEIKNPLNFVNNFSSLSGDLIVELREALQGAALDDKTRAEIDELSDMLKGNLDKVVQHGKRADSIVRNMLLHSRSGSGEHRPVDINGVVEESLNLAYHGARAEGKGFNIMLERNFDPGAGEVDLFPQEITRVLLNLISNGFYATTKRRAAEGETGYKPVLAASTKSLGDAVEIRIRDNGTGIPPDVKEKMFNPFFTTKPAGEGTGLGLSLSYDIIVKQHAGTIEVETEPDTFTEFRIVLPRGAATLAKTGGNA
ncbi:MAG: GAF domain-containing protein [Mesorhizobium sp.]|uniref:GAF domain-containing protein n=1 Tax=Mesorhizobium sp. TaxID=1871066 RepID=UPI0011F4BDAC|nr:GAF domain-containing protein [Mesorhizobium sp.]TIM26320.1 MAG: GAF domain-containing protein [Mesorhizobium sp.]